MVLDPVSAFGVCTAVVQLISFGGNILSKSCTLYRDGRSAFVEINELDAIAHTLIGMYQHIQNTLSPMKPIGLQSLQENTIQDICKSVCRIASELIEALDSLKVRSRHARWRSFREALYMIWNNDRIDELARTLERYHSELDTFLLVSLRYENNTFDAHAR
jgi:hypothetical protein